MTVPNIGPEHFDQGEPYAAESPRRGNPAPMYGDQPLSDVGAATTRAAVVSHRFGGVRYALSRPGAHTAEGPAATEEGDSDARN